VVLHRKGLLLFVYRYDDGGMMCDDAVKLMFQPTFSKVQKSKPILVVLDAPPLSMVSGWLAVKV
jgi:hypothetical protein